MFRYHILSFFTLMMAPWDRISRQRVRHDHQAMRPAAGGGFIVILRNEFRDGLGEFVAESRPVVPDRKRTSVSTARVVCPPPSHDERGRLPRGRLVRLGSDWRQD